MKKVLILLIVFLFIQNNVRSQQYNFHNYSVKDGVAQSQIYALLQDSRGYLWLGTRGGGISRFDGLSFKTYSVNNGLANNYISCFKEDAQHNIWIGTNNGLSKFNGLVFKNFLSTIDTTQLIVYEIDIDSKNRKWLATNQGVLLFDDKKFTNVSSLLNQENTVINSVLVDDNDAVWFGNSNGLFKITDIASKFRMLRYGKEMGFNNNSITAIKQDKDGKIWIGTYGDGAYVFDGRKFYRVDNQLELYKQTVLDFCFDKSGNVWLATLSSGVAEYNVESKTFNWLTDNEGLSNNHVRSIIQDKWGNFWFGTSGGGLCNYFGKQFTNYDKSSGLGGNFIYYIFKDSKSRLWIGTSDKGLSVYDSLKFTNYNASNGFQNVKVKAIQEDNFGAIYFGTDGDGLYVYKDGLFTPVEGLSRKYIRAIVKDNEGNLWIATAGTGLYKLNIQIDGITLDNFTTQQGLLHNRLTCLHYDKKGRIWYGTENDGIGWIENGIFQTKAISRKDGLKSNAIRCLTEDQSGFLWIGTAGYGISSLALYQGSYKIRSYDYTNGLTSSNIYLLISDNKNNLFVGTETGLDYVSLDASRKPVNIKHYGKGEGFEGVESCLNSVCKEEDGTIWFGSINGMSKYNPGSVIKNEHEPVTSIIDIKLFYESIEKTKFGKSVGDWNKIEFLDLPYNQNHLTFEFNAINFSNPDAVKYRWKLEGFDKDWSPISKNHSILYSNLGAGEYTFMVMACNEDGVWNKEAVILKFRISAPFWLEWWFISSIVFVVFGALFLLFKWRINRVKTKSAELQKKLQLEKEVVQLEQKALRLQMNPHFIFNALNSIQSQIGNDNEQVARYYLAKFSRLMRQILDNSRNASISLEEEISTLENYLLIEKFCNGDKFDYTILVDENIEKDFVKIPPMMLQPFIENSIKHGLKHIDISGGNSKRGYIEVEFKEIENMLECSVTDNGIGREKSEELNKASKETYHKSTALIVTQERLDLLKRDENVSSLEIIDLLDESGNAKGTKVIVRIPIE